MNPTGSGSGSSTMTIADSIERKLRGAFAPIHFELENESHRHSAGLPETHFRLVLVSSSFEGVSRVDRQRRVTELLADERTAGLHALTMRVMTPGEWDKVKDGFEMVSPVCRSRRPGGDGDLKRK